MKNIPKRVVLVVGHSEDRPGAWGVPPLARYEYSFNTDLAQKICSVLNEEFEVVIGFRDGLTIHECYKTIKSMNPDYVIELHFNSSSNSNIYGTETLCTAKSRDFAALVQKNICAALKREGRSDRGVKILAPSDRGYIQVSLLECPTVILEPAFGSNPHDARLLVKKDYEISYAILRALLEHELLLLKNAPGMQ